MPIFTVTEVCSSNPQRMEAPNDYYVVAEAAACAVNDVDLPIWEQPQLQRANGLGRRGPRCYMPADRSGRQWIVEDGEVASHPSR